MGPLLPFRGVGGLIYNRFFGSVRIHWVGPPALKPPRKNPFWSVLQIYNIDTSNIILYKVIMLDTKEIRRCLKVLLRKSKGVSRLKRIDEMNYALSVLNMHVVRQKRRTGFSVVSIETIDYIDALLKRVQHARLNPKFALRGFVAQ